MPLHRLNKFVSSKDIYFYNTSYSPGKLPFSVRNKYLTRGQMAYFMARLHNHNFESVSVNVQVTDVSKSHYAKAAIDYVIAHKIMPLIDGEFLPDAPVKREVYIRSLVSAMNCHWRILLLKYLTRMFLKRPLFALMWMQLTMRVFYLTWIVYRQIYDVSICLYSFGLTYTGCEV